jgi:hypothetical protein
MTIMKKLEEAMKKLTTSVSPNSRPSLFGIRPIKT